MKNVFLLLTVALCFCLANRANAQTVDSGTTGDCTWTLTGPAGNYTLTISGNGAMAGYSAYGRSPWYSYRDNIKTLDIQEGVTVIGFDAFYHLEALTGTVNIPNSVTTIGAQAFIGCGKLTSVHIGNSVTTIGTQAFYACGELISVTIGNSVTTIGYYAFGGCAGLTSVMIPNSVTTIETGAFASCTGLTSVTIPNSVTKLGQAAFSHCTGLTSVTIGDSLTTIEDRAFNGCTGLTSVTIGNSVITIDEQAFLNCSSLLSVTIPNSVTTIGAQAFSGCTGLTSVTIGNSVTTIRTGAFSECAGLTSIVIPNSATTFGLNAFEHCTSLTSATLSNSMTTIASGTFYGCTSLTSVMIPNSVTTIEGDAFLNCSSLTSDFRIPNSVTTIGEQAFYGCTGFTSILIPNSVKTIGNYAFRNCTGLTSIVIPNSVTTLGEYIFQNCTGLTSVVIGNSVTAIEYRAFTGCSSLTSVTIPNSVTAIKIEAFNGCSSLTSIMISNSVTAISTYAFRYCNKLTDLMVNWTEAAKLPTLGNALFSGITPANVNLHVPSGTIAIYEAADVWKNFNIVEQPGTSGAFGPDDEMEWELLSNGTLRIKGAGAMDFEGNLPPWEAHKYKVTSAVIAPSVTTIGESAFEACTYLTSVSIADEAGEAATTALTSIEAYAFKGCLSLESIDIPAPVTSIATEAFAAAGLQTITVHWTTAGAIPTITEDVFPFQTLKSQMSPMTLHVPGGTKALYEAANVWKEFTIVDEQAANTYALTIGTFTGGAVTADKTTYAAGELVTLAIAPATGYTLNSISAHKTGEAGTTVPLTGTDNTRTFTMPAYDVTIEAAFNAPVTNAQTPVINGQPQSLSLSINTPAVLTVTASVSDNGTLTYQWYGNTGDSNTGGTAITGATANSYSPPTTTAGTSWYYVVVTNTNNSVNGVKTASTTSATASVTVDPATGDDDEDDEDEGDDEGDDEGEGEGDDEGEDEDEDEGDDPATPLYTTTIAPSANGWVTATPWNAAAGETVTLTITPAIGYELASITAHPTGTQSESIALNGSGDHRTFTMPACDVTITATFRETTPTGTAPSAQAKTLSVHTQNGRLCITGLTPGQPWYVYTITGKLVINQTASAGEAETALPSRGVYIVRSGKCSVKVSY